MRLPTQIGPYRLVEIIGEGGMGQVWSATKDGKTYALKILIGENFSTERATMFEDEARAASVLSHESIVETCDFGVDGKIHYIAMQMVRGACLKELLDLGAKRRRALPPLVVAYIGTKIASALHYAHTEAKLDGRRLRMVHRDVSPHNVLIDRQGRIFLTDFGVARTTVQVHRTTAGTVRGKPSYMAPEQVRGQEIDHRTDLFALGTCLYESSSVRRLFGGKRPAEKMKAVLKKEPRPLVDFVPDYPMSLWRLIARALEKDPKRRHQTAAQLHQRLLAFLQTHGGEELARRRLAEILDEWAPESNGFSSDTTFANMPTVHEISLPERPQVSQSRSISFGSRATSPAEPTIRSRAPLRGRRSRLAPAAVAFAIFLAACCSGVGVSVYAAPKILDGISADVSK